MTGMTPDLLAAMARRGAEAPFYSPATALPQLGEKAASALPQISNLEVQGMSVSQSFVARPS